MIDLHCHLLPGMDDGSSSVEETLELAKSLQSQGITRCVMTPHFYATAEKPEKFLARRKRAFANVESELKEIPIDFALGAEVAFYSGMSETDLKQFRLGDTSLLLLEMPFHKWTKNILNEVKTLSSEHQLILAHIERYFEYNKPTDPVWEDLENLGILFQVNCDSIQDKKTFKLLYKWFLKDRIHFLCSDSHNMDKRPPHFAEALKVMKKKFDQEDIDSFLNNSDRLFDQYKIKEEPTAVEESFITLEDLVLDETLPEPEEPKLASASVQMVPGSQQEPVSLYSKPEGLVPTSSYPYLELLRTQTAPASRPAAAEQTTGSLPTDDTGSLSMQRASRLSRSRRKGQEPSVPKPTEAVPSNSKSTDDVLRESVKKEAMLAASRNPEHERTSRFPARSEWTSKLNQTTFHETEFPGIPDSLSSTASLKRSQQKEEPERRPEPAKAAVSAQPKEPKSSFGFLKSSRPGRLRNALSGLFNDGPAPIDLQDPYFDNPVSEEEDFDIANANQAPSSAGAEDSEVLRQSQQLAALLFPDQKD